jgi:hypothetical protein
MLFCLHTVLFCGSRSGITGGWGWGSPCAGFFANILWVQNLWYNRQAEVESSGTKVEVGGAAESVVS